MWNGGQFLCDLLKVFYPCYSCLKVSYYCSYVFNHTWNDDREKMDPLFYRNFRYRKERNYSIKENTFTTAKDNKEYIIYKESSRVQRLLTRWLHSS